MRPTTPVSIVHALRGRARRRPDGKTPVDSLAHEQAALRRVATLVAKAAPPAEVFARVAEEAMDVLGTHDCALIRDAGDGTALVVAACGATITNSFPVGTRLPIDGAGLTATVVREGRPHRIDDYAMAPAKIAEGAREHGVRSAVGCPIVVGDEIWGAMVVAMSGDESCPPGTEQRLAQFADLASTAIANAQARAVVERLADEQAAQRRVATLVAQAVAPAETLAAVAEEVGRLFDLPWVGVMRYDPDDHFTVVATWGDHPFPTGSRWPLDGPSTFETVLRTGRAARFDEYEGVPGTVAEGARKAGILGGIGAPIVVEGTTWGVIAAPLTSERPIPEGVEVELNQFTELVASAISNAESRKALARLAGEQAALRRVATLVASGVNPGPLFDAVAGEVETLFGADISAVVRFERDGTVTVMGAHGGPHSPGARVGLDPDYVVAAVYRTGQAARFDSEEWEGQPPAVVRDWRVRSALATPIVVEGELWGAITIASIDSGLVAGTDRRLADFGALFATAIANTHAREQVTALAEEQAALRRVATLAARELAPVEVLAAVTEEAARALGTEAVGMLRFERDGSATLVAQSQTPWDPPPLGTSFTLEGENIIAAVHRTGQTARMDDWADATGAVAAMAHILGVRSAVATPIVVEGRLWGTMIAATSQSEPLPADTEWRIGEFTELVATAISNAESREALGVLAEEQAALRRVAVLVAQQPSPDEVFTAVTEAVAPLLGADLAAMHMFTVDGTATTIAGWSAEGPIIPVGTQLPLDGDSAVARIFRTGAAARIDSYVDVEGETAAVARGFELRSTVGAPIVVEGRLWGALMAATRGQEPLRQDAETRIAEFTELVATAVSNAESRAALSLLADEQASLRRVATLVAQGVPAPELFSAVTKEVEHVVSGVEPSVLASVIRFDPGPESVLVGASRPYEQEPIGSRWAPKDLYVSTRVLRTGRAARVDEADLESLGGPDADVLRLRGFLHQVGSPVVVEGRLWGAMTLNSKEALPPDVDQRLVSFTELVATAIANAESQSELAASRRRIVAASDDARRRIERDLHDGIQQQLVSLGMELGELEASLPADGELRPQVAGVTSGLRGAIDDLREISRGIHPAILAHGGLGPALKTLSRRSSVPVQLNATINGRLPERVEVAAYYVVSEALTNVARHARASAVSIDVVWLDGRLQLSIRDDGVGGADPGGGTGLIGLKDRVEALGGEIKVESPTGHGTSLAVTFPLGDELG